MEEATDLDGSIEDLMVLSAVIFGSVGIICVCAMLFQRTNRHWVQGVDVGGCYEARVVASSCCGNHGIIRVWYVTQLIT